MMLSALYRLTRAGAGLAIVPEFLATGRCCKWRCRVCFTGLETGPN